MPDNTTEPDSVEERLDSVEEQLENLDFSDINGRIEKIEHEQGELRTDLELIVENLRKHGKKTPHVESVEGMYTRLGRLEKDIASLRETLEVVIDSSQKKE